jgi:hypothetical protein
VRRELETIVIGAGQAGLSVSYYLKTARRDHVVEPCTPESWDNIYSTGAFLRTIHDVFAVRRPIRLPMVPRSLGDLHRIAAADLLHPDIEFPTAVRAVGDVSPVG